MAQTKRPRRQRAGDKFAAPALSPEQRQCDYAVAPFDRMATEMDRKWGIDRLPALVSTEMAVKYGKAICHLNAAIEAEVPEDVAAAANNCIRGMQAMDQMAEQAGHQPATGKHLEHRLEDFHFAIVLDEDEWPKLRQDRPDLMLFTMREVAVALRGMTEGLKLDAIKNHFPDAKIAGNPKLPQSFFDNGGDELPF